MQAKPSYSVRDLANLSGQSESKVRRLVDEGRLAVVADVRSRRITAASAHEYLRRLIDEGPKLPEGAAELGDARQDLPVVDGDAEAALLAKRIGELEQTVRSLAAKVEELDQENERFRNTIQGLRHTQVILLDNLGEYTSPKIPNH